MTSTASRVLDNTGHATHPALRTHFQIIIRCHIESKLDIQTCVMRETLTLFLRQSDATFSLSSQGVSPLMSVIYWAQAIYLFGKKLNTNRVGIKTFYTRISDELYCRRARAMDRWTEVVRALNIISYNTKV